NLNVDPIKVNDKTGNPIMIGQILVWKLKDTYKAMFEIDSQTLAAAGSVSGTGVQVTSRMRAFESFVRVQSDAALREVAGMFAYDENGDITKGDLTLRAGGSEINDILLGKLNDRLAMSGLEVIEARINYLAYSPEIAAVMLRRQQAAAIIAAREKIVEGAVSMVKMALDKLKDEKVVELDDDKKAAMVSNLMVVLCADDAAQPVVNTGTLYQ
ncbi:MAG: SPFH domain-containing protein, partial [Bacteroidales bacterium]|nr:SPFH domain-containing protein [Bacteroidales bacterium]